MSETPRRIQRSRAELLALAARVEAAQVADREIDLSIQVTCGLPYALHGDKPVLRSTCGAYDVPRYTASIDAAASLFPEGAAWMLALQRQPDMGGRGWNAAAGATRSVRAKAATPALSLTAAALRAMAEEARDE